MRLLNAGLLISAFAFGVASLALVMAASRMFVNWPSLHRETGGRVRDLWRQLAGARSSGTRASLVPYRRRGGALKLQESESAGWDWLVGLFDPAEVPGGLRETTRTQIAQSVSAARSTPAVEMEPSGSRVRARLDSPSTRSSFDSV